MNLLNQMVEGATALAPRAVLRIVSDFGSGPAQNRWRVGDFQQGAAVPGFPPPNGRNRLPILRRTSNLTAFYDAFMEDCDMECNSCRPNKRVEII